MQRRMGWWSVCWIVFVCGLPLQADIKVAERDAFHVVVETSTTLAPDAAFDAMVKDFGTWWGGDHSFSGDGNNLSLNVKERCMLETLPDGGFVRHMELVFYQPGKQIILRGGLGPLTAIGCNGSLIIQFRPGEDGKTLIVLNYHVHGPGYQSLDKIAPAVDQVLTGQMSKLAEHLNSLDRKNG